MNKLLMVIPSRGRPRAAFDAAASVLDHRDSTSTIPYVAVDDDDPCLAGYLRNIPSPFLTVNPASRIGPLINKIAAEALGVATHIGFMGDDHRIRTRGFDSLLSTDGVAYGNDLIHGEALATAFVMSSQIPMELGYMIPPGILHLFFDNAAMTIGSRYGLTYRPDVTIEHLHPIAGKGVWDDGYELNNSPETWKHDEHIFDEWKRRFLGSAA
jgi:hypothetical protein